jgi:hypothetical protein
MERQAFSSSSLRCASRCVRIGPRSPASPVWIRDHRSAQRKREPPLRVDANAWDRLERYRSWAASRTPVEVSKLCLRHMPCNSRANRSVAERALLAGLDGGQKPEQPGADPGLRKPNGRRELQPQIAGRERAAHDQYDRIPNRCAVLSRMRHADAPGAGYSEHRPTSCRKPSLCLQAMRGRDHSNRAFRPVAWPASRLIRRTLRRCGLTGCARSRSNAISACTTSY